MTTNTKQFIIRVEVDSSIDGEALHQALCKAIHEGEPTVLVCDIEVVGEMMGPHPS